MTFQNFSGNVQHENLVRSLLADDEVLVAIVESEQRFVAVTSGRVILHEKSGGYSVIRNSQISAVEVSDSRGTDKFVKIYFGGGLSRTIGAPNAEQADAIASAAARQ